ncbi:hypothetical protein AQUCO_05500038v1 [Aquilegia coerulea]|uniref:Phenazine biosynthesis protein n=1 Tax=Aquilegia coerulea TaxID=218851 RepID=A0A2G5CGS5_AQUCA|nr:hypothetical protein AQUCO_05500038v1 [Aquilegia coerulea]
MQNVHEFSPPQDGLQATALRYICSRLLNQEKVDAFTDSPFKGNPAAVCLLEEDRDEDWLQSVAKEFNISETCYLTRIRTDTESTVVNESLNSTDLTPRFLLRWFTPVGEVKLCGHATLASAHVLLASGLVKSNIIEFSTLSGILTAKKVQAGMLDTSSSLNDKAEDHFSIELDFPTDSVVKLCGHATLASAHVLLASGLVKSNIIEFSTLSGILTAKKVQAGMLDTSSSLNDKAEDHFSIELDFPTDSVVECEPHDIPLIPLTLNGAPIINIKKMATTDLQPKFDEIHKCPGRGVIITGIAPSESGFDFFSRFFCPKLGVNEVVYHLRPDTLLTSLFFFINRGGILDLHLNEETQRLLIAGRSVIVMEGSLLV